MKLKVTIAAMALTLSTTGLWAQGKPKCADVLATAQKVNAYFMKNYADPTKPTFVKRERPSHIWTRGVYYEGLMSLYEIYPDESYYTYAYQWADFHKWGFRHGNTDRNADDYCCAQTYIDLYKLQPEEHMMRNTRALLGMLVNTPQDADWYWVDAIQMGMPVLAKMGSLTGDKRYFDKAWDMYAATRNKIGDPAKNTKIGLFDTKLGLWYRDKDFLPPFKEVNGQPCFWSRGNGWAYATLVKVMKEIPANEAHRKTYLADFKAMSKALLACQRADGFWNASLLCEENFGGKEATGTSLFVYGMAWGVNNGILDAKTYLPVIYKAWDGLVKHCVREDGSLGYVQGTGSKPSDGQPATATSNPDFEDYGIGCFLLAATEVYRLAETGEYKK